MSCRESGRGNRPHIALVGQIVPVGQLVAVGRVDLGSTDERGRAAHLELSDIGKRCRNDRDCGGGKESDDGKDSGVVEHDKNRPAI